MDKVFWLVTGQVKVPIIEIENTQARSGGFCRLNFFSLWKFKDIHKCRGTNVT